MAITREEIEREKKALPFGWGRFGKAYDQLAEISADVLLPQTPDVGARSRR